MVRLLESWGERIVRLVVPSVTAQAASCTPWVVARCVPGCWSPFVYQAVYVRTCDGVGQTYTGPCGSCNP